MKIIFLAGTWVHHALIAAHIYVGSIREKEFQLEHFDRLTSNINDFPIYIDDDEWGNQVYILTVGKDILLGQKILQELALLLGNPAGLLAYPVHFQAEPLISLTSLIPSCLGGNYLKFKLANHLIKRDFPRLKEQVNKIKVEVASRSKTNSSGGSNIIYSGSQ